MSFWFSKRLPNLYLLRTENIEEDAKYYKDISDLKLKSSNNHIEHGNSNIRKCKFYLLDLNNSNDISMLSY